MNRKQLRVQPGAERRSAVPVQHCSHLGQERREIEQRSADGKWQLLEVANAEPVNIHSFASPESRAARPAPR